MTGNGKRIFIFTSMFVPTAMFTLAVLVAMPTGSQAEPAPQANKTSEKSGPATSHYDKNSLHRLDLRILGKSCPVCLLGIQKKVNALPGVVKAAVMLKRPYGASFVYDCKQVDKGKIIATITSYEKATFVGDISDAAIAKAPLILVPPFALPVDAQKVSSTEK